MSTSKYPKRQKVRLAGVRLWRVTLAGACCERSRKLSEAEGGELFLLGDVFRCRECGANLILGLPAQAAARVLGQRGGRQGGLVRAAKLSPERRREIAVKAAHVRWGTLPTAVEGRSPNG